MTSFLLDSNVLIAYSRGIREARLQVEALLDDNEDLGLCGICVTEYFSGVRLGAFPEVEDFIRQLRYWPIRYEDSVQAGVYRYSFARQGIQLSTQDMLIAAVARRIGAVLVTDNTKDFPMSDIVIRPMERA